MDTRIGNHEPPAFFFTVRLEESRYGALIEHIDALRLAFKESRERCPFALTAGVILPDHLHCILRLPSANASREALWRLIKRFFERSVGGASRMWQPDFLEYRIQDEPELSRLVDRLHADPVRHALVRFPMEWPYSSFHAYVAYGLRPAYWYPAERDVTRQRSALRAA